MFNKDHYTTDVWKLYKNTQHNFVELAHRFKESTESKANISASEFVEKPSPSRNFKHKCRQNKYDFSGSSNGPIY